MADAKQAVEKLTKIIADNTGKSVAVAKDAAQKIIKQAQAKLTPGKAQK